MDITVVCQSVSKSIEKCIEYCKDRGLKLEIVSDRTKAKGKYIVIMKEEVYYNDYYIHLCYLRLYLYDVDIICFNSITVYDKKQDQFYKGLYLSKNVFYKRNYNIKKGRYIEYDIELGCTTELVEKTNENLTNDEVLQIYHGYFGGLKPCELENDNSEDQT